MSKLFDFVDKYQKQIKITNAVAFGVFVYLLVAICFFVGIIQDSSFFYFAFQQPYFSDNGINLYFSDAIVITILFIITTAIFILLLFKLRIANTKTNIFLSIFALLLLVILFVFCVLLPTIYWISLYGFTRSVLNIAKITIYILCIPLIADLGLLLHNEIKAYKQNSSKSVT